MDVDVDVDVNGLSKCLSSSGGWLLMIDLGRSRSELSRIHVVCVGSEMPYE